MTIKNLLETQNKFFEQQALDNVLKEQENIDKIKKTFDDLQKEINSYSLLFNESREKLIKEGEIFETKIESEITNNQSKFDSVKKTIDENLNKFEEYQKKLTKNGIKWSTDIDSELEKIKLYLDQMNILLDQQKSLLNLNTLDIETRLKKAENDRIKYEDLVKKINLLGDEQSSLIQTSKDNIIASIAKQNSFFDQYKETNEKGIDKLIKDTQNRLSNSLDDYEQIISDTDVKRTREFENLKTKNEKIIFNNEEKFKILGTN